MQDTNDSVPRADLRRPIRRKPIRPRSPIRQLSAQLDRLIEFAPGISRKVLAGTTWEHGTGRDLYKAAIKPGEPTDAGGESLVVKSGGRRMIKGHEVLPTAAIITDPDAQRLEGSHRVGQTLRAKLHASQDLRNPTAMNAAVRKHLDVTSQPEIAKRYRSAKSDSERAEIRKESKAHVQTQVDTLMSKNARGVPHAIENTRNAIAQDARINKNLASAITKRNPELKVGQRGFNESLIATRESFDSRMAAATAQREASAGKLFERIRKNTHSKLMQSDPAWKPNLGKRERERLKMHHEKTALDMTNATLGVSESKVAHQTHAAVLGVKPEGLAKSRANYQSLLKTDYDAHKGIQRHLIRSGKVFENVPQAAPKIPEVNSGLKSFPTLKKIGIGAGLVGAGLLAKKLMTKKQEPQKQLMSSRRPLIQFARGDILKKTVNVGFIPKRGGKIASNVADTLRKSRDAAKAPIKKTFRPKTILTPEEQLQRAHQQLTEQERKAKGLSKWTATEHEHQQAGAIDYSKQGDFSEGAIRQARREALPPDAPHSLHPNAKTHADEAEHYRQQGSFHQAKISELEKHIADSKDPHMRANHEDEIRRIGSEAGMQKSRLEGERDAAIKGSDARLRKGVSRVMGARRAALGRQAVAHGQQIDQTKKTGYRNAAIAGGVGVLAGASLTGNDSHKPKRQIQFSGDTLTAIQHGLMAAGSTHTGAKALRKLNDLLCKIERKAPIIAEPVKGFIKGGRAAIPGSGIAGAALRIPSGIWQQFRKRQTTEQVVQRIQTRPTTRMSAKGDILKFDVSPIQNLRNKIRPEERPTTGHDIAVGGIEGGAGVLATDRLIKKFAPEGSALWRKLAIGTGVGALATGLIGAGVSAASKAKKDREAVFSSKRKFIQLDAIQPGTRTRVATDRYVKQIHERDMDRTESGYLRTGAGGAAIGALTAKRFGATKGKAALIGGLAGLGTQAIVRQSTKGTRDQFGDRSFAGKRADRAPSQVAGVAALGLAGKAAHDKLQAAKIAASGMARKAKLAGLGALGLWGASKLFSAKQRLIRFDAENPDFLRWKGERESIKNDDRDWRRGKSQVTKATQGIKRGHRLLKDVVSAAKGQKNLDSRGRERKREWDKPWVRNAVTTGILGTTAAVFHKSMRGSGVTSPMHGLKERIKSGQAAQAAEKIPGVKVVREMFGKLKKDTTNEVASATRGPIGWVNKLIDKHSTPPPMSTKGISGAAEREAQAHNRRATKVLEGDPDAILGIPTKKKTDLCSRSPIIRFAAEDWEQRREGDLLQVAKIRRRDRREKSALERKHWQDAAVTPAKMGLSFIGGGLVGKLYANRGQGMTAKTSPTPSGGTPIPFKGATQSASHIEALAKKAVKKLSSTDPLIELNSILDAALA